MRRASGLVEFLLTVGEREGATQIPQTPNGLPKQISQTSLGPSPDGAMSIVTSAIQIIQPYNDLASFFHPFYSNEVLDFVFNHNSSFNSTMCIYDFET